MEKIKSYVNISIVILWIVEVINAIISIVFLDTWGFIERSLWICLSIFHLHLILKVINQIMENRDAIEPLEKSKEAQNKHINELRKEILQIKNRCERHENREAEKITTILYSRYSLADECIEVLGESSQDPSIGFKCVSCNCVQNTGYSHCLRCGKRIKYKYK